MINMQIHYVSKFFIFNNNYLNNIRKIIRLEEKLKSNLFKSENLKNLKEKDITSFQNDINFNADSLQMQKNKNDLMYIEFDDLKIKLERQITIYETEILNKKLENEKVFYY